MDALTPVLKPSWLEYDNHGKPRLPLSPEPLFAFGNLIRRSEELLLDLFGKGLLSGTVHTCIGQELCQMAVVRALDRPDDAVLSTHRNHGHFLTYSGDVLGLVAEIMGRDTGICGGRGGSQHLIYKHFHSNGIQGGMTAIAVGLARARALSGSEGIVAVMVGDGTMGEGLLYESLNLASLWSAPVLFVVEANGIAQTTPTTEAVSGDILARGAAFGLSHWRVSDDDPRLWEVAETAVRHIRSGRPGFLVIDTRRLGPHSKGDDLRTAEEMAAIRDRDPLSRLGAQLNPKRRAAVEAANIAFINEVLAAAKASPEARYSARPGSLFGPPEPATTSPPPPHANEPDSVRIALNRTLDWLLAHDESVILLGEDLHDPYGGAFKVTNGLSTTYPGRVISTPISEAAITGAGIGLALAGRRPLVEIMFADFLSLCLDQILNHAVKFSGIAPHVRVPLVIRTPTGGRRGYGPTHSQSLENIFTAIPGLTVLFGSQRHDVGRLLADTVKRWPHPTLFLEHKLLYGEIQTQLDYVALPPDPEDTGGEIFPTVMRRRPSADLVIVAYGGMVSHAEAAAARLENEDELQVEIVIPALLAPLPRATLTRALASRPRILVVEETVAAFGVAGELAAALLEAGFAGRFGRVGAPSIPIPSARSLEMSVLPGADAIVEAALHLISSPRQTAGAAPFAMSS